MVKRIDTSSIKAVREFLTEKESFETLKQISDNIITAEEQKKKQKTIDANLIGYCNGEDVCGKEPSSKNNKKQNKDEIEYDKKQENIESLKASGLIIEGQHTPLKSKPGEPDEYDKPIRKFALTSEGEAILSLAEQLGLVKNVKKSKDLADEVQDNNPDAASEKGNIRTKADQKKEDKESDEATRRTLANQRRKVS